MNAAAMLLDGRRTNTPIDDLPPAVRPVTLEEAYFIQDRLALAYGEIGGWKVGAPTADATPMFAPMPWAWIASNNAQLGGRHRYRGLEAEIAFLIGRDCLRARRLIRGTRLWPRLRAAIRRLRSLKVG